MYCKNCGNKMDDPEKFCSMCGMKRTPSDYEENAICQGNWFDSFMYKVFLGNGYLSYKKAGNIYSAVLVLIQFIGLGFSIFLGDNFGVSYVGAIFLLIDWYCLSKQGIRGLWKVSGLFIIPIYLLVRAIKTDKNYVKTLLSTIICLIAIIILILYGFSEDIVNSDSNNERQYNCENEENSKVQETNSIEIDLYDYLPADNLILTYAQWIDSTHTESIISSEYISYDGNNINFTGTTNGLDIVTNGYYWVDEQYNCVYKTYSYNLLGNFSESVILIPNGKSYTFENGNEIASPPQLFTITTEARIFENCLCISNVREDIDGTYITKDYYAPGIGLVLTESRDPLIEKVYGTDDFVVTYELISIQNNDSELSKEYSVFGNGRRFIYEDVNGIEHIGKIYSYNDYVAINLSIDDKMSIDLSFRSVNENRYFTYESGDGKYYLEYDNENLASVYFWCEEYSGECMFLPDETDDMEYGG